MELKKGMTEGQLIKYLYSEYKPINKQSFHSSKAECFDIAVNHMQFCETELNINQFVNPIPKPHNYNANQNPMCVDNSKEWELYKEGEKKVIFNMLDVKEIDSEGVWFFNGEFCYFGTNLSNVFHATKGQLELQNVAL